MDGHTPPVGTHLGSSIAKNGRARSPLQGISREISVTSMGRPDVWASRAAGGSSCFVLMGTELCSASSPFS